MTNSQNNESDFRHGQWQSGDLAYPVSISCANFIPQQRLNQFLEQSGERTTWKCPVLILLWHVRLSTLLATGRLSMRQVVQQTWATQAQVKSHAQNSGELAKALAAFQSRLHWHCHFIQKFESEPEIRFHNMACQ